MPETDEMEYLPIEEEIEGNCSRGLRLYIERLLLQLLSRSRGQSEAKETVIEF